MQQVATGVGGMSGGIIIINLNMLGVGHAYYIMLSMVLRFNHMTRSYT